MYTPGPVKYAASPKFIHSRISWQRLKTALGQKSNPISGVSHKQPRSRSRFEIYDPLPHFLPTISRPSAYIVEMQRAVERVRGYSSRERERERRLPPHLCPPLIPKVYKYRKGMYSPKGRLRDHSCNRCDNDDALIQKRCKREE